ncbi:MAG: hypothetical protein RL701_323 [Pseudomonadota bacterium]
MRRASFVALALFVPLAMRLGLDPGITIDDSLQRTYGDALVRWYRSGFVDSSALTFHNLYLYGGLFDLPAQWLVSLDILPWDTFAARHALSALVAVLGVWATWFTAARIAGPRAGALAALMLALTPAWLGHGLFNSKDIPFGAAAAVVMYASVRIVMRRPPLTWRDAVWAGVALGLALGVRSGGMFMLGYPLVAAGLRLCVDAWRPTRRSRPWRGLPQDALCAFGRLVCVLPLTWLIMLSAWPWAQLKPFTRPFEAAAIAAHFKWRGRMRFDGAVLREHELPWNYLPTWFRVTLPDLYALALACGIVVLLVAALRRKFDGPRMAAVALLLMFVLAPIAGVVVTHPIIYDAHRHFLFLIPPLAALAGVALQRFLFLPQIEVALRAGVAVFALYLAGQTFYDMWTLHPYEYVYFNRASGGLAKQASRFETDYWGAAYREGFEWVVRNYDPGGTERVTIATCGFDRNFGYYRGLWHAKRFVLETDRRGAQLYISMTRNDCHHARKGDVLHVVERQGVPLLYVYRVDPAASPKRRR